MWTSHDDPDYRPGSHYVSKGSTKRARRKASTSWAVDEYAFLDDDHFVDSMVTYTKREPAPSFTSLSNKHITISSDEDDAEVKQLKQSQLDQLRILIVI